MLFAKEATKPAAPTSFIPNDLPIAERGLLATFVNTATKPKAPANVTAIEPTTTKAS